MRNSGQRNIEMNLASCGGGFGGRDHTPFLLYVALAAMAFPIAPSGFANNWFAEQFQSGIKRHAFVGLNDLIGVDRATGKIVGSGGRSRLGWRRPPATSSAQVASVGANAALRRLLRAKSRRHHVFLSLAWRHRGFDRAATGRCRP